MNKIQHIYNNCISYLSKHAGLAIFLSHGGIHILVLILLSILGIILYNQTYENETTNMSHIRIDAYEDSDSINEMLYFPRMIYGDIDLDNNEYEKDSLSFNLHFFRADMIVDEYDFTIPDSMLSKSKASMVYEIETNCKNTKPILDKEVDGQNLSFKELNDKNGLIYKVSSDKSLLDLKEWSVPFRLTIDNESNKYPTSILYLELNLESNTSEPLPDFTIIEKSIYAGSNFRIKYGHPATSLDGDVSYKPYDIKYVFPEPDIVTPFYLEYSNSKSVQRIIDNKGVYLVYEDVVARNKANRISLQYSILIGAIIAFMLDIIVNLILKWRRLSRNRKELTSNENGENNDENTDVSTEIENVESNE